MSQWFSFVIWLIIQMDLPFMVHSLSPHSSPPLVLTSEQGTHQVCQLWMAGTQLHNASPLPHQDCISRELVSGPEMSVQAKCYKTGCRYPKKQHFGIVLAIKIILSLPTTFIKQKKCYILNLQNFDSVIIHRWFCLLHNFFKD